MEKSAQLPTIRKKKMIDVKKIEILAKKVRKIVEEEMKYLQDKSNEYENHKIRGISSYY